MLYILATDLAICKLYVWNFLKNSLAIKGSNEPTFQSFRYSKQLPKNVYVFNSQLWLVHLRFLLFKILIGQALLVSVNCTTI